MIIKSLSQRKKEVLLTVLSNLALQVATALTGFLLPPLVIGTFGSSVNGMVSSISQFIAYLNIVEAGVGGAAVVALYRPLALGDRVGRNAILSAAAKFYRRSGIFFTILIFILAFSYPLIVGNEVDRMQAGLMVLVLGITGVAEFFLIGKYRVLLTADKKVYVISLVQIAALIISTALAIALIKTGFGIVAVKFTSALVYLMRYVLLLIYVRKKYSDLDFHTEPDTESISQSKNVLVHQIGGLVVFNSPLVIITFLCSLKEASVYTVYAMVFSAVGSILGAFSNGMQSFFGESLVKESIEQTRSIFGRYETIFFAVEGYLYTLTYLLVMPFMRLYTNNMTDAVYLRPHLAFLFVAEEILNNLRQPSVVLVSGAGMYKETQVQLLVELFIRLVFSIAFTVYFGMIGVLFGGLISFSYRMVVLVIFSSIKILKKMPFASFAKMIEVFTVCTISVLLIQLVKVEVYSFVGWIMYALVCAVLLIVPLSAFVFLPNIIRGARRRFHHD